MDAVNSVEVPVNENGTGPAVAVVLVPPIPKKSVVTENCDSVPEPPVTENEPSIEVKITYSPPGMALNVLLIGIDRVTLPLNPSPPA